MTEAEYKAFISHQRYLAESDLHKQLSDECEFWGWERSRWRKLRQEAQLAKLHAVVRDFSKKVSALNHVLKKAGWK